MTIGWRWLAFSLGLVAAFPAGAKGVAPPPMPRAVIGYVFSARGFEATIDAEDDPAYTHVMLSFLNPDPQGLLVGSDGQSLTCMAAGGGLQVTTQAFANAVAKVHARGQKAIGSMGGGTIPLCAGDWAALTAADRRAATVATLMKFVDVYRLDGLDVDIESDVLSRMARDGNYIPFVQALRRGLKTRHKLLTATTASYVGGMVPLNAIPYFDYISVMAYDDDTPGAEHAALSPFRSEIYLWLGRGVPRDRLIMGVPFYGHGYGTYNTSYGYGDLETAFGPDAARAGDVIGQRCAGCSYITYNSPATLTEKARWATAKANGVMVWEIAKDTADHTLIKAVAAGLGQVPTPGAAPAPVADPAGQVLNTPDARTWTVYGSTAYRLIADAGVPGGNGFQVSVRQPTDDAWDVGAETAIAGGVKAGDRVRFAVWARLEAADPDTQLDIPAAIQLSGDNGDVVVQGHITVTTRWQKLWVEGPSAADHAAKTMKAVLSIGNAAKTIDIGPAEISDSGPAS